MAAVCTVQPAWSRCHLCLPGWEYIEFQALGGKLSIQPWEGSGPCGALLQQEREGNLLPQSGFIFSSRGRDAGGKGELLRLKDVTGVIVAISALKGIRAQPVCEAQCCQLLEKKEKEKETEKEKEEKEEKEKAMEEKEKKN